MWLSAAVSSVGGDVFLLTHPVWDVTSLRKYWYAGGKFLLTHPVWDVTYSAVSFALTSNFYSHIPCGMWRQRRAVMGFTVTISTHTSRVGCDRIIRLVWGIPGNFYSHIPCGMWRDWQCNYGLRRRFLLTHPVWDVTVLLLRLLALRKNFSSHIPCGMWRY